MDYGAMGRDRVAAEQKGVVVLADNSPESERGRVGLTRTCYPSEHSGRYFVPVISDTELGCGPFIYPTA